MAGESEGAPQITKKINRRSFLKQAGRIIAGGLVAATLPSACAPAHHPEAPKPTFLPDEYKEVYFGNMTLLLDKDGLPVSCKVAKDKVILFDQEKVKEQKAKAIASKEPEIVSIFPTPTNNLYYEQDKRNIHYPDRHKPEKEKPQDIVSEERLAQRGVTVIQGKNTKIYFRGEEKLFQKGGLFEPFNNTGIKLVVVLVDGLSVNDSNLQDPKYDQVRDYTFKDHNPKATYQQLQEQLLQGQRDWINGIRLDLRSGKITAEKYLEQLLYWKGQMYKTYNVYSKDDLNLLANGGHKACHTPISDVSYVFIAVGKREGGTHDIAKIYFDDKGKVQYKVEPDSLLGSSPKPKASESYPEGSGSYGVNFFAKNNEYAISSTSATSGSDTRHEFIHARMDNKVESEVDNETIQQFDDAFTTWRESGFQPEGNKKFNIVFENTDEPGSGYILT